MFDHSAEAIISPKAEDYVSTARVRELLEQQTVLFFNTTLLEQQEKSFKTCAQILVAYLIGQ